MWTRRQALWTIAAGAACSLVPGRLSFAAPSHARERFVLVMLRGGLDGLHAVIPHGDGDYSSARGAMAMDGWVDLDGFFGLHPSLGKLEPYWRARQLAIVHAVATPYRKRSHFDGQDVLDNGTAVPMSTSSGWLNRALASLGDGAPEAAALGRGVPLVLRGPHPATSLDPTRERRYDAPFLDTVGELYAADPALYSALAQARATQDELGDLMGSGERRERAPAARWLEMTRAAGRILSSEVGPRVAVLEVGGWDTHNRQGLEEGTLANLLGNLATGLSALAEAMSPVWDSTVVALATEFGRTVRGNGTRGTDHGTASIVVLLGGAVAGGRVLGDWPGLGAGALYEGRDLMATTDSRSVWKGILAEHMGVGEAALAETVFPSEVAVPPLEGLISGSS